VPAALETLEALYAFAMDAVALTHSSNIIPIEKSLCDLPYLESVGVSEALIPACKQAKGTVVDGHNRTLVHLERKARGDLNRQLSQRRVAMIWGTALTLLDAVLLIAFYIYERPIPAPWESGPLVQKDSVRSNIGPLRNPN
jgi:hypothetical protein